MVASLRLIVSVVGMIFALVLPTTNSTFAITAELARKCQALTAKAFPPRERGNPAAGSAKGSGRDQQAYYGKCVENDGKVPDTNSESKPPAAKQE